MKTHPVRTIILIILTFAQAVCVFGGMVMVQEMRQELAMAEARLGADILVYPTAAVSKISTKKLLMQGTPVEVYRKRSKLEKMNYCEGIKQVSHQIYISDTLSDGSRIWIIGVEPENDFVVSPWLMRGESLRIPTGSVAVGSKVVLSGNSTVTLYGKEWPVRAHLTETGSILDYAVFASMDTLEELIRASEEAGIDTYSSVVPAEDYSVALVRVLDRSRVESVTDWINIYVRKVTAVRSEETLTQAATEIKGTTRAMAIFAGIAWFVLLLALIITQSMIMKERMKEIFVWHSVGASRSIVNRVMLSEAGLTYMIGALSGALLTSVLLVLFGRIIYSDLTLAAGIMAAEVIISVLVTVAAGLIATYFTVKRATGRLGAQMLLTV